MNKPISKSSISEPEARLIELCQTVNFGRIHNLKVAAGQPVLEPAPRIIKTRKMGTPDEPRAESNLPDYWLKQPVVDLLQTIRNVGDGEILSITVMHGLPHVVEIPHHVQR